MTILIFLAILIALILVHEFGHFIVAKCSGIRVDEFGIGFPPKLFGKKYGETEYTINWLPMGGFVRIWGEDPTDDDYKNTPDTARSFVQQPKYIQIAVLVAGVFMNILFAFLLYVVAYLMGMPSYVDDVNKLSEYNSVKVYVTNVLKDTPASEVLKPNDQILGLHTKSVTLQNEHTLSPESISSFVSSSGGETITFDIERKKEHLSVEITPKQGVIETRPESYVAGFAMSYVGIKEVNLFEAIVEAGKRTGNSLFAITVGLFDFFKGAFTGASDFSQVTGPIGIIGLVGDAAAMGIIWLLSFSAFISLNLAVINLLPFPALDGGRVLFVLIEILTRRPINPKLATRANQIGLITLLTLMAIVTIHDILKLF